MPVVRSNQTDLPDARKLVEPATPAGRRLRWCAVIALCVTTWAVMRAVFFVGIIGSDDLYYMRFAAGVDRPPMNHWEARLIGNALIALAMSLTNPTELAAVMPSLFASLVILASVMWWTARAGSVAQTCVAGLMVAVLPLDVDLATMVSPFPIMTAFMMAGTVAFLHPRPSTTTRWTAAVLFALGVVAHYSGIFYLGVLVAASFIVDRKRFTTGVLFTIIAIAMAVAGEMLVLQLLYGDPTIRLRVCQQANAASSPISPFDHTGGVNWFFFTWPAAHLLFSKGFGIALLVAMAYGVRNLRRLSVSLRVLVVTCLLYWFWISYGTRSPWSYVPFWRMSRFLHPLILPVAVLTAHAICTRRRPKQVAVAAATVLGICLVNLLGSGSGGQNVQVSRELSAFAAAHPQQRFVTDYHTLNEMWAVNELRLPPNVVALDCTHWSQLLDRSAVRISPNQADQYDGILVNPINAARLPAFAQFVRTHAGAMTFETSPSYRDVCAIIPSLRRYAWSLRKPPAQVYESKPLGNYNVALKNR